jgi:hypothetical protein
MREKMAEKVVNYDDNIFFLQLLIKSLKDGLKLDLSAGYFVQKIAQDIFFYATTIDHMYKKLKTNNHLLNRIDYLKNMQRLKMLFNEMLDDILSKRAPLALSFGSYTERLSEILRQNEDDVIDIRSILSCERGERFEQESLVSPEEFKHLLAPEEENS